MSSFISNRQHKDALKKLLLYESNDDNKTNLLSLLYRLNIKTDSILSQTNYNNSSVSIDNLSALYEHYQIDQQMYPLPDLQFDKIRQPSFYLSHSYLQPCKLQNNSNRRIRKKSKRFKSNRNRKKNKNKQTVNENFHYRNMITVRRISCHDIRKRVEYQSNKFENTSMKNEQKRQTRSANLVQNKSEKYQTCSIGFQSSPKLSTLNEALVSPSTTNSHSKILTTPMSNTLFSQRDIEKEMSNSVDITESKVISLHDSSISSLVSTQLRTTGYDQIKPDVTIETSVTPGSRNNFRSLTDRLSMTTSSIVPHFSSTIAPHVSHHTSSSTIPISNAHQTESPISPNENIQDLIDQLKTCIDMLSVLLQNKSEHEKLQIPNIKSYSNQERIDRKKKQSPLSSSLSLSSISDHSKLTQTSIPNKDNLIFEDITVRRCNSPIDQIRKKYPNDLPTLYNDHHNELKRCLLVYCRNRNNNEKQRNSHCINELSRSSPSLLKMY